MSKKVILITVIIGLLVLFNNLGKKNIMLDVNKDGKVDSRIYYRFDYKIIEKIDTDFDGKFNKFIYWGKNDSLEKIITISIGGKNTYYFLKGEVVVINGDKYIKQLIDDKKTYSKKRAFSGLANKTIYYSKNRGLIRLESVSKTRNMVIGVAEFEDNSLIRKSIDNNQDGAMDEFEYYKFGKLQRTERDTNFDGKIDEIRTNFDGAFFQR
ncbi:MAG: hypothetical protein V1739_08250 [Candidatus Omnitrophota bacterium]